jgi:positive regulator of sigma E activity
LEDEYAGEVRMENLKLSLVIRALIGALIGIGICLMLYAFGEYDNMITDKPALLGAINMGTQIVYDIEAWGIRKSTIVHYLICVMTFICASTLLHWFSADILWIVLIIFTVIYMIIWFIYSTLYKREVRQMNSGLEKMLRKGQEGGRS